MDSSAAFGGAAVFVAVAAVLAAGTGTPALGALAETPRAWLPVVLVANSSFTTASTIAFSWASSILVTCRIGQFSLIPPGPLPPLGEGGDVQYCSSRYLFFFSPRSPRVFARRKRPR